MPSKRRRVVLPFGAAALIRTAAAAIALTLALTPVPHTDALG